MQGTARERYIVIVSCIRWEWDDKICLSVTDTSNMEVEWMRRSEIASVVNLPTQTTTTLHEKQSGRL